jgi:hypothetical protein
MKFAKPLAALAALALAFPASAALPPQYQRAAELKAILDHAELAGAFPQGQPIDRVEFVRPDLYRVTAGTCFLYAQIVGKAMPAGMVGARQFDVELSKVDCPPD